MVTPEGIAVVEAIVKENRSVTVNEIAVQWRLHGKIHCVPFVFSK